MGLKITWEPKPKTVKRQIKDAKRLKKGVASTLKWMQVESIESDHIVLKHGGKEKFVKGIKLQPINIFIEPQHVQQMRVGRLRNVYNTIPFKLYHSFVFNPVNLDHELTYIARKLEREQDESVRELLQDDINKMLLFIASWYELEFFITIQESSMKKLNERYEQLEYQFEHAGFSTTTLNRIDYENYTAYIFENQMINDFLFGHGSFEILNDENISKFSDDKLSSKDMEIKWNEGQENDENGKEVQS